MLKEIPHRISPLGLVLQPLEATFSLHSDDTVDAVDIELDDDVELYDVSMLDRLVVKGPSAVTWLASHGIDAPSRILGVIELPRDGLVARTGANEVFLEDGLSGDRCAAIAKVLGYGGDGVYLAPPPTASMIISGKRAPDVLRETCNVDFREPTADVVMTRVAGVSCIILFRKTAERTAFQLWFDGTYADYLGATLSEIVRELPPLRPRRPTNIAMRERMRG